MWRILAEMLLLRRPESAPGAFWRWFRGIRLGLVLLWVGGAAGLVARWGAAGGNWGTFFRSFRGSSPQGALVSILPALFLVGFVLLRRPVYLWAKRRFFERVRGERFEVCLGCAYSLKGLPEVHRCPECGMEFYLATTREAWARWMDMRDEDWPEGFWAHGP